MDKKVINQRFLFSIGFRSTLASHAILAGVLREGLVAHNDCRVSVVILTLLWCFEQRRGGMLLKTVKTLRYCKNQNMIAMVVKMLRVRPTSAAPAQAEHSFTAEQLDNLVSPIALYPDPLLAQILTASTFPDQIPEAAEWADILKALHDTNWVIGGRDGAANQLYRLNVFPIDVPPLRNRKEDIPMLVEYFVQR